MTDNTIESRRAGDRQLAVRIVAMPADTNPAGDIFGGWLMSQVDVAGSIAAIQLAKGRVATVAVHDFLFLKPVLVGDLVSCYAEVIKRGRTSVRVKVDVYAERESDPETVDKVAEATITYVAVDDETRAPKPLPGSE
ncbi:MAG: acyl-CoA thioesterase [Gammaproteobacteria bacterium]|nr:acyl-CoA thioesterase [Gammaproteobacteria bacterium]